MTVWADGVNEFGCCPAGGRGMLTQGPAPDLKYELNITSFLILSRISWSLYCYLSDGRMGRLGGGGGGGDSFMLGFRWQDRG